MHDGGIPTLDGVTRQIDAPHTTTSVKTGQRRSGRTSSEGGMVRG
jgi:hypothetical protein